MSMVKKTALVAACCLYGALFNPQIILAAGASSAQMTTLSGVMGSFPEINAWLIAIFTFLGLFLRITADLLGFISKALAKSDSGWASRLSDLALTCSSVVGWFGGGTPKVVLENKIDQAKAAVSPATVEEVKTAVVVVPAAAAKEELASPPPSAAA